MILLLLSKELVLREAFAEMLIKQMEIIVNLCYNSTAISYVR